MVTQKSCHQTREDTPPCPLTDTAWVRRWPERHVCTELASPSFDQDQSGLCAETSASSRGRRGRTRRETKARHSLPNRAGLGCRRLRNISCLHGRRCRNNSSAWRWPCESWRCSASTEVVRCVAQDRINRGHPGSMQSSVATPAPRLDENKHSSVAPPADNESARTTTG